MDPKAKKSIFLGYRFYIKGLYDTEKLRVFYCRDVIFNESRSIVERMENEKNDGDKKHSVVEIKCQYISESEDDNLEKITEPQRSKRIRKPPDLYRERASIAHGLSDLLRVKEALFSPEKAEWWKAMEKEMESFHTNEMQDLVKLPSGRNAIGCKWVFKRKHDVVLLSDLNMEEQLLH